MPELENLDDVSFSELMNRSVSEIPQLCHEWTDFNAHDPGITFLEMLMWLTEMQRYYLSRITERHLESYLRLIGTTVRAAEPAVILARFFSEETASVTKKTVFYIGDIPYRPIGDMITAADKPEVTLCENGGVLIRQDLTPFKGGILPLYFSPDDEKGTNLMRDDFYSRAKIKARLITKNAEAECPVKDGTYGLYQSGFINISLPEEFDESTAFLRLEIISDDYFKLPPTSCFNSDIRELIQLDKRGNTLGADGRVKENVSFSADIGGQKVSAAVYKEIVIGRNAETPQDSFGRFRSEQKRLPRAADKEDYIRLAMETPGLRAEVVNVFSKEAGKVSVCVKTAAGDLRENEIKNLRKVLFEAKPVGTEIEILSPIIFSARLVIGAKTDGWAGGRKLMEHIGSVFEPLEKSMGAPINMPELYKQIGSSPVVSEIRSMILRLGKGIELTENDTLKLPEDGLLSLDEIMIQ
ncbi:MAG: baseplate J/gp47 family protein [Oscillospiraceae bacterium]|nr:baseplate J/gp47 family protein [Oscillospiraceae bacterium]